MKIGILTVFDAVNYGSFLQAFCLQEYLKSKGHEVVMIKTTSFLYEKWRFTSLYTYLPDKMKFKKELRSNYHSQWGVFHVEKNPTDLDLLIIGSDEMWELNNVTFKPQPAFFGGNISAKVKATYAVSSNSTTKDDVSRCEIVKKYINNISYVSVRDKSTLMAYKDYLKISPEISLDPTLLIDLNIYKKDVNKYNYILCYTYSFKPYMINAVKKIAIDKGKKIIVVGQNFPWADECIPASAFQFLGLLSRADFIITDTFHGITLSIALKKDFVAFAYKNKVLNELEQFDLLDRNVEGFDNINRYWDKKINYEEVYKNIINPMKEKSFEYLMKIIS